MILKSLKPYDPPLEDLDMLERWLGDSLPPDETVLAILSEMEALKSIFEVALKKGSQVKTLDCVRHAIKERSSRITNFEGSLIGFCLEFLLGSRQPFKPVPKDNESWAQSVLRTLACGWSDWLITGSTLVLKKIENLFEEDASEEKDDIEGETVSLKLLATAIDLVIKGKVKEAKAFFEYSNEAGAQFGTKSNLSICWIYALTFYNLKVSGIRVLA